MLLWFGRCVIVCVCVKIFKEVNEWTAGVVGFGCGEDIGGGYLITYTFVSNSFLFSKVISTLNFLWDGCNTLYNAY